MKLAISNIAWSEKDDDKVYKLLKQLNIKHLEIAPTRLIKKDPYSHSEEASEIVNKLKDSYNLEICSMQSIWFGKKENIFENKENFVTLVDYTKKAIDFAASIKCSNLVFGCPKNRNMIDKNRYFLNLNTF